MSCKVSIFKETHSHLTPRAGVAGRSPGGCFHSSTLQLNLSRRWSLTLQQTSTSQLNLMHLVNATSQHIPQKDSRQVGRWTRVTHRKRLRLAEKWLSGRVQTSVVTVPSPPAGRALDVRAAAGARESPPLGSDTTSLPHT
jgi:hypothetical protein